jgi:hypothetical protein
VAQSQTRKIVHKTLFSKIPNTKADGVTQGVGCQPSKHECLSSNPSNTKKKEKKNVEEWRMGRK